MTITLALQVLALSLAVASGNLLAIGFCSVTLFATVVLNARIAAL